MKSNKGITLISLIIYIIVFMIVITTVATISGYFTKNTDDVVISANSSEQYTRLTTYLTNDLNSINYKSINIRGDYIDITFLDNSSHQYVFNNNKIYYISYKDREIDKELTLCNQVTDYSLAIDEEKSKLKISITIDGITYNNNYSI